MIRRCRAGRITVIWVVARPSIVWPTVTVTLPVWSGTEQPAPSPDLVQSSSLRFLRWILLLEAFAEDGFGDFPDRVLGEGFLDVYRARHLVPRQG